MSAPRSQALALIGVGALLLTGCSAPTSEPSRADIAERFLVEYTDAASVRNAIADVADDIAGDMLEGDCGDPSYAVGLGDDANLVYAWKVTCLTYFKAQLSADQVAETEALVVERASS